MSLFLCTHNAKSQHINELELFDNDVINFTSSHHILDILSISVGQLGYWAANIEDLSDHFKEFFFLLSRLFIRPRILQFVCKHFVLISFGHPMDEICGANIECIYDTSTH